MVEDLEDKFGTGSILPKAEFRKELGFVVGLDHELEKSTALLELTGSLVIWLGCKDGLNEENTISLALITLGYFCPLS